MSQDFTHSIATILAPAAVSASNNQKPSSVWDHLQSGDQVHAKVLAQKNDGSFFVEIAEHIVRMELPQDIKIGSNLTLNFIKSWPRATFLLPHATENSRQNHSGLQILAHELANAEFHQVSDSHLPAAQNPSFHPTSRSAISSQMENFNAASILYQSSSSSSSETSLSDTGRLINHLLQATASQPWSIQSPIELALLSQPALLAEQFKKNISSSGLFYESHLAQYFEGKISKEQLMLEPQFQQLIQLNPEPQAHSDNSQEAAKAQQEELIHAQLDALDQQRITGQTQIAADLALEWEICKESGGHHDQQSFQDSQKTAVWQTILTLTLPNLGTVSATIKMQSNELQLTLKSDNDATIQHLQQASPELQQSLSQTDAKLSMLSVQKSIQKSALEPTQNSAF